MADARGAFTGALPVVSDGVCSFQAILKIDPPDLAGLQPTGLQPTGLHQHEIGLTEVGKVPSPVASRLLVIRGTVKGSATT